MSGDDADVLTRAKRGDRGAFGALVRKYQRRVYATALHITGNHQDAADVAQDAFVRAYKGLARFDERSDLFTWLYRITVNTALNHLRSRKRVDNLARAGATEVAAEGGRPERLGDEGRTPREWLELQERYRRVLEEVGELSPSLRITLLLATVEEKSYREIAEILEIPEGTVAWRVNEARKQLKQRLAGDRSGEDPDR
jgi:RNA polymerase sigma-70 factor (ECF subfamily)